MINIKKYSENIKMEGLNRQKKPLPNKEAAAFLR